MEVLSGVGGNIGVRCSERRIGCCFYFPFNFSSLIFSLSEKEEEKKNGRA